MRWQGLSVLVSLCPACCKPAAILSSEYVWLSICSGWPPSQYMVFPQRGNISPFTALSQRHKSSPNSFVFPFILLCYIVIFLVALVVWSLLPVFSGYSVWIVPHVVIFLMYLWEEVSSTSFFSAILIATLFFCFSVLYFIFLCSNNYITIIIYSLLLALVLVHFLLPQGVKLGCSFEILLLF